MAGVRLNGLGIYLPAWTDGRVHVAGPDEDVTTMAVAAGALVLDRPADGPGTRRPVGIEGVVLVVREPDQVPANLAETVLAGLGLGQTLPFSIRLGGAPELLQAVVTAAAGTLVLGVDPRAPAAAGAVLLAGVGTDITAIGSARVSAPVRFPAPGGGDRVYQDPRFLRDVGWSAGLDLISGEAEPVAAGGPIAVLRKLRPGVSGVEATGPAGAVAALADAAERGTATSVLGLDNGTAYAVRVNGTDGPVARSARPARPAPPSWDPQTEADLPLALPAYTRAFEAKIGFLGSEEPDGTLRHPPRRRVPGVPGERPGPVPLPRSGKVYSHTTIHAPVPGKRAPYTLAVVDLDGVPARALAHVTDSEPGTTIIGDPGRMVLRRVAVRQGVSDYGYAFQPKEIR